VKALPPQTRDDAPAPVTAAMASAGSPRPSALAAVLVGGSYGALVFGGVVSLLHVLHNRVGAVRDALAIWTFFALCAGIAAAAATASGALGRALLDRDRNKGPAAPAASLPGLGWGLALFQLVVFLPVTIYGRTYDEAAFAGPPRTATGMIALLLAAGLLVGAVTVVVSLAIARRLAASRARGSLGRIGLAVLLASIALHVVLPPALGVARRAGGRATAGNPFRPLRATDRAVGRVVLIGLDGADWRVLRPLVERGEAPTFAELMSEGAWGPLATAAGENSATIWASIYTGKRPRQHGVLDFYRIGLPGMAGAGLFPVHRTFLVQAADVLASRGLVSRRIADRSFLETRPLWEIVDDLGASVGVVDGYHFSVPARPLRTGRGFFYSYALNTLAQRPDWSPASISPGESEVLFQPAEVIRYYAPHSALADFDWQAATLLDAIDGAGQPDFVNLYTHQPDTVQHQRWKWYQPELFVGVDPADVERWGAAIPDTYRAFDRFLGALVGRLAPGTTLVVVSDHGHSPTVADRMYSQHRHGPPGILLLWGDAVRRGVELEDADVYDVTPTILHLLGFPVGADMAGRVLLEALAPAVAAAPVRTLESYDAFAPARFAGGTGPDLTPEEIERLRALGYL
jgi:hypothetical protein